MLYFTYTIIYNIISYLGQGKTTGVYYNYVYNSYDLIFYNLISAKGQTVKYTVIETLLLNQNYNKLVKFNF